MRTRQHEHTSIGYWDRASIEFIEYYNVLSIHMVWWQMLTLMIMRKIAIEENKNKNSTTHRVATFGNHPKTKPKFKRQHASYMKSASGKTARN